MIRFLQKEHRATKFFLGAILLLISISMVLYLIPGFMDTSGAKAGVYARVGDQEVTSEEVRLTARRMAQQNRLPEQLMAYILPRAADQLVTRALLVDEAHGMGLSVSDEELREEFRTGPISETVFPNGKYIGDEAYKDLVQNYEHISVEQFEKQVKAEMLVRKLQAVVTGAVTIPESALQQEFKKRNTKVKFDYALLTTAELMKQVNVSEPELRAYFEKNPAQYKNAIPEKRKARYVLIENAQLNTTPTLDELRQYYNAHQDQYRIPDRVKVRHILIKIPAAGADGKVDSKAVEEARAKIGDVMKQLRAGSSFEQLAQKYSQDTSASKGGDLGWLVHGQTVAEFDKTAFATEKGKVSDIIKTQFGFHILRVDDKEKAHVRSLDEVKAEIEPQVKSEKVARESDKLANAVQAQARTQGLERAAVENHLHVVTTDYFSQTDSLPGLGNAPEVTQTVFGAKAKSAAMVARLPQGYAIVEVLDVRPPQTPKFEDIRSRVEQNFRAQRAGTLLGQKTAELSEKARAGHDLRQAAKEVGATLKTSELVGAQGQVPDIGSMSGPASVALSMSPGQISEPLQSGGNGFVIALLEKKEPSAEEFTKGKEPERETIMQQKRQQAFDLFAENLKSKMEKSGKVRYNAEERNRLFGNNPARS